MRGHVFVQLRRLLLHSKQPLATSFLLQSQRETRDRVQRQKKMRGLVPGALVFPAGHSHITIPPFSRPFTRRMGRLDWSGGCTTPSRRKGKKTASYGCIADPRGSARLPIMIQNGEILYSLQSTHRSCCMGSRKEMVQRFLQERLHEEVQSWNDWLQRST